MTHAELLRRTSSKELTEWMAFDSLEPISADWRADLRHSVLCALIANCHRSRNSRAFSAKDFMPDFDGSMRPEEQSADQMMQVAKGLAKIGFGRIIQGGQADGHDCQPDHATGDEDRPIYEGPG